MFLNPHHLFHGETLKNKCVGAIYFPVPTQFPAILAPFSVWEIYFSTFGDVVVYQSSRGRHRSKGGSEGYTINP